MELNDDTLDIFREDVNSFASIDRLIQETQSQIKPIQTRLKDLRSKKKELERDICSTLDRNNLKQIESPGNKVILQYQVKKSMVPMTQKTVKDKMIDFFKRPNGPGGQMSFNSRSPEEKGSEVFEYIYGKQNRDYKTKEQLKVNPLKNEE